MNPDSSQTRGSVKCHWTFTQWICSCWTLWTPKKLDYSQVTEYGIWPVIDWELLFSKIWIHANSRCRVFKNEDHLRYQFAYSERKTRMGMQFLQIPNKTHKIEWTRVCTSVWSNSMLCEHILRCVPGHMENI